MKSLMVKRVSCLKCIPAELIHTTQNVHEGIAHLLPVIYSGAAPDLGAYETTYDNPTAIGQAVVNHAPTGRACAFITASGRIVIKVDGGALYNAAGQRLE